MGKQILFLSLFLLLNVFLTPATCDDDAIFTLKSIDVNPVVFMWDAEPNYCSLLVSPEGAFEIELGQKSVVLYDNIEQILSVPLDITVKGDLNINDNDYVEFKAGNTNQWKLYVFEDFQGSVTGWNNTLTSSCGSSNNKFLGGYCNFAGTTVNKTWEKLPTHRMVKITFNFHYIDEWNGQSGMALIDGKYGWQEAYSWCASVLPWYCKKFGINACGNEYPDKIALPVEFQRLHSGDSLTLEFSSTLTGDACMASWGIDDVSIYLI